MIPSRLFLLPSSLGLLAIGCSDAGLGELASPGDPDAITIVAEQNGELLVAADVLFSDPYDGAILAHVQTDARGAVALNLGDVATAMVTVFSTDPDGTKVATMLSEIHPGESTTISWDTVAQTEEAVGTLHVTVPPMAGAASYSISAGQQCHTDLTPDLSGGVELSLTERCISDAGQVLLVATALDPAGVAIGFATATISDPIDGAEIAIAPDAWSAPEITMVDLTDAPPGALFAVYQGTVPNGDDLVAMLPDLPPQPIVNGSARFEVRRPAGLRDASLFGFVAFVFPEEISGQAFQTTPIPANLVISGGSFLSPIGRPVVTFSDDPTRPIVSWTATQQEIDGVMIGCGDGTAGTAGAAAWMAIMPPDATSFQYPELPPELRDHLPTGNDAGSLLVDSKADGWEAARLDFFGALEDTPVKFAGQGELTAP